MINFKKINIGLFLSIMTVFSAAMLTVLAPTGVVLAEGFFNVVLAVQFADNAQELAYFNSDAVKSLKWSTYLDMLFPFLYSGLFGILFKKLKSVNIYFTGSLLCILVIGMDLIENARILDALNAINAGSLNDSMVASIRQYASIKWSLIALIAVLAGVGFYFIEKKKTALVFWLHGLISVIALVSLNHYIIELMAVSCFIILILTMLEVSTKR